MWYVLRPVRLLAQAFTAENSPRQLAWGFALGAVIGLVPKGNLLAIALMTILSAARVNLAAGLLGAFLFSWCGMLLDPLSHRIGESLLTWETLTPLWTSLYNLPLVPWTHFNNTVVLGSLTIGLILLYPAYRCTEPAFARLAPVLSQRVQKYRIARALWGAEWAGKLGDD